MKGRDTMAVDGIHAATVYVSDQTAALAWYQEVLGFEVRANNPFEGTNRWIEVAPAGSDAAIVLIHGFGGWSPEKVGTDTGIILRSRDVPGTCQDLQDRGVVFDMPAQEFPWGWNAIFRDLDGNRFVLGSA
ncbi:MAG: VOC family protein [Thermomicrobiales bacterium]